MTDLRVTFVRGALAAGVTAYLAAVCLTADACREGHRELTEAFRALITESPSEPWRSSN